jgi:ribonuclease D
MYKEGLYIPDDKHVDIQDLFRINNCPRTGMAAMAAKLIHPKYAGMKDNFVSDFEKRQGHDYWDFKPLADMNLEYAATDGYVTYELARIITLVRRGGMHLTHDSCTSSSMVGAKRQRHF